MTAALAFALECAAAAALVATAAGLVAWGALALLRPALARVAPARAADAAFLLGVTPALAALGAVGAAALPSLAVALGRAQDHCLAHLHHLHLCLVHSGGVRPPLAVLGAAALGVFLFRAWALADRTLRLRARVAGLRALGRPHPAHPRVVVVPGAARLCHATGARHGRILVSEGVAHALGEAHLEAALAHEAAHLRRRDPLAALTLAAAGLLLPPPLAGVFARSFRRACEEACDAEAAHAVGEGARVAAALLALVRLKPAALGPALGFGAHALERRVQRLLAPAPPRPVPARALGLGALGALAAALLAAGHAGPLHHAVETLLHHLS